LRGQHSVPEAVVEFGAAVDGDRAATGCADGVYEFDAFRGHLTNFSKALAIRA
jgi:hypothetical protein